MITYILESETPEGVIYYDTRASNCIHLKFDPDEGEYTYPPHTTARHVLNLLHGDQVTKADLTWEILK